MAEPSQQHEFSSWRAYWDFANAVKHDLRFVRTQECDKFLEVVLATSVGRQLDLQQGQALWRAQLGCDWEWNDAANDEFPQPFSSSRMKPIAGKALDGRVNPRGIACLYLALDKHTAMLETRPWIGSRISVGQFRTTRELKIIDCSRLHAEQAIFFEEPPPPEREKAVWASIDQAFARPIGRDEDAADYVPTQILAELFKRAGFDGIAYKSGFSDAGFNVALFNLADANLQMCELHGLEAIEPSFSEDGNPYYVTGTTPTE